ncbi:MAG: GNAT family N-acetyltransferase [Novosphingobium sp.]|nr:GNAT family N-acetyltransferase [Novosphingobium sp.]
MRIVAASKQHLTRWSEMRHALWDFESIPDHAEQVKGAYLSGNSDRAAFIATCDAGTVIGFAEATLRRDYVEGCDTSPVAFLEGIYVEPDHRHSGVARALADAVADWGRERGCSEFASNALIDNTASHAFHAAIGFAETLRVVFFRKEL